jgi:hypothetical protein
MLPSDALAHPRWLPLLEAHKMYTTQGIARDDGPSIGGNATAPKSSISIETGDDVSAFKVPQPKRSVD